MNIFDVFRKKKPIPEPWAKYYTKEELNIKIPNISMFDQIRISASRYPNHKAIEYFGSKITYKQLLKKINKASISLKKLGVKKGDIASICLPNVPESLIILYALNKIGAIANMIHPLSSEEELKQSLTSTNSKLLFMINLYYEKIENIIEKTKVEKVIYISAGDSMNIFLSCAYRLSQIGKYKRHPHDKKHMSYSQFMRLSNFEKLGPYERFGANNPAVIIHSGGTSGTPKNVVIQNRAFYLGAKQTGNICLHLKPGDCCLAIMPNFHGFGLSVCMHTPLTLGCYTIMIPTFNAKKFDTLFKKTKPTVVLGVPTLFEALINCHNEKHLDLSQIKYLISGGDILTKSLEERVNAYMQEHNSKARITQGYGLSEVLAAVTLAHDKVNKSGSIGIPLPGNHIKIIDPSTRKTLKYGKTGEIVIHSKAFMMGYLNDEIETNKALQIHDDGHIWLHTGDLGYMDEDGFVFYQGRSKRMIISSGYNVYPSHVEEVIESHPAVLQCSVVGMPHPYKKEVVKAFIVLKDGYHGLFIKTEIKDYCKKNLAKYMVPYQYVYRKKLPKTKLGKVDFKALQQDTRGNDDE